MSPQLLDIIMIAPGYPTRDAPTRSIFVRDQAQALAARGHRVTVLSVYTRSLRSVRDGALLRNTFRVTTWADGPVSVRQFGGWATRSTRIGVARFGFGRLMRAYLASEARADVVHAHFGQLTGAAGAALADALDVPLVITEHSSDLLSDHGPAIAESLAHLYRRAEVVVAVSEEMRVRLRSVVDATVIPNMVDTDFFTPLPFSARRRRRLLIVGSLIPLKRHDRALKLLAALGAEYELTIVGSGPLRQNLLDTAEALGVRDRVRLVPVGDRGVVRDAMRSAALLLSCSEIETFGLTLAEAMAVGLPVLATDSGGPRYVLRGDGSSRISHRIEGEAEWVASLEEVDDEDRAAQAAARRLLAVQRFGRDAVAAQLERAYEMAGS